MGIYEYQCPRGHVTERFVKLEERSQQIECEGGTEDVPCLEHADLIVSATPTTFRANDRKAFKRTGR